MCSLLEEADSRLEPADRGPSGGHARASSGIRPRLREHAEIVERSRPASGVTARSFAWINIVHRNAPVLAQLRNLATTDYRRLENELSGALAIDWNGALTWTEDPAESERAVTEHTAWGYDVRLVEKDEIRRLEPGFVAPPPVAAHAPGEGAIDGVKMS